MKHLGLVALLLAAVFIAGCVGQSAQTGGTQMQNVQSGAVSISIADFSFHPQNVTVRVNSVITWTNNDPTVHTVNYISGGSAYFGGFASPAPLSHGETYSWTPTTAGTYEYGCSIHPYMRGTITVVQ